jgi:cytoskeletal protein CcmA (bactofilin family)
MLDHRVDDATSSVLDPLLQARTGNASKSSVSAVSAPSMIGKSLVIKGEITGSESVQIEGTVEGIILLPNDRVTVGPSGHVTADVTAQDIVVLGELTGTCEASDIFYVRRDGSFSGSIVTSRISVEDGAFLTGTIDIRKEAMPAPATTEQETAEPETPDQELLELAHVN